MFSFDFQISLNILSEIGKNLENFLTLRFLNGFWNDAILYSIEIKIIKIIFNILFSLFQSESTGQTYWIILPGKISVKSTTNKAGFINVIETVCADKSKNFWTFFLTNGTNLIVRFGSSLVSD